MMNGRYLLDTNVVISFLKEDEGTVKKIEGLEEVYVPVTVIGELFYGARNSGKVEKNTKTINDFLSGIPVLGNDRNTAKIYGEIKYLLKKKGKPIPENDIWIAAVARQHNLAVFTFDLHFKEIEDLKLALPLEK